MTFRALETDNAQAPREERGFVLVWTALTLFLLLGVAAIAVDLVHAYLVKQEAQNAVDAASLAGVVDLPDNPAAAVADAKRVAAANGFTDGVDRATVTVTPTAASATLEVRASKTFDTFFGGVLGFKTLTVTKSSTAKFAPPKQSASKLDVVLVIDRTQSMSGVDTQNTAGCREGTPRLSRPNDGRCRARHARAQLDHEQQMPERCLRRSRSARPERNLDRVALLQQLQQRARL